MQLLKRITNVASLATLLVLGSFMVAWGVRCCLATNVGGMFVDYVDDPGPLAPTYILNVAGWLRRLWYAGIAVSGVMLVAVAAALRLRQRAQWRQSE